VVRVLTWNLWWRFGPWQERQPAIAEELARIDPDVALLQEVWADDGEDQAEQLAAASNRHLVRTTTPDGDPQQFGNAIISRWPILSSKMIRLSNEEGRPSHRSALAAVIETPAGPQLFTVTHLAWQYDAGPLRLRQLAEVVALISELGGSDGERPPPILAGDLNAVPESDEVRRLTGLSAPFEPGLIFTDCWAAVGDGPGYTWTRDNPHSVDALWPRRRLDYVFVAWPRPKPLSNPLSAELAGLGSSSGVVPSDHYAVVVELDDRQTLDHE
jgi:endonuclease/exonuclease/phosphatase family metal-dependent hydrolase